MGIKRRTKLLAKKDDESKISSEEYKKESKEDLEKYQEEFNTIFKEEIISQKDKRGLEQRINGDYLKKEDDVPKLKPAGCLLGIIGAIALPFIARATQDEIPFFRSVLNNGVFGYSFLVGAGFGFGYALSYYIGCLFNKDYHDDIFDGK